MGQPIREAWSARSAPMPPDGLKTYHALMGFGALAERIECMRETANERLLRIADREIAIEAMRRIRARLQEVEAAPEGEFKFESEWEHEDAVWPQEVLSGRKWVKHLLKDLEAAEAAFARCR